MTEAGIDVPTKWGPRSRVRSVGEHNYCFTRVFLVVRTIVGWGYKPTKITFGGPTLYYWGFVSHHQNSQASVGIDVFLG